MLTGAVRPIFGASRDANRPDTPRGSCQQPPVLLTVHSRTATRSERRLRLSGYPAVHPRLRPMLQGRRESSRLNPLQIGSRMVHSQGVRTGSGMVFLNLQSALSTPGGGGASPRRYDRSCSGSRRDSPTAGRARAVRPGRGCQPELPLSPVTSPIAMGRGGQEYPLRFAVGYGGGLCVPFTSILTPAG